MPPAPTSDWPAVQLHIVTGKGGTGKSTVAAALALAIASRGKTVLLCEVEGRQGIAQLFDVPPLPYEERRIAHGSGRAGGDVYALAIDPESAMMEYLAMYYRLGRAGKALDRPAYALLGGKVRDGTTISYSVANQDVEKEEKYAYSLKIPAGLSNSSNCTSMHEPHTHALSG